MPANLTPQYQDAERRFKEAHSLADKVAALQEMMATIPKHKGTEKLQAQLKKKMSGLRNQHEEARRPAGSRRDVFALSRDGARQLALAGAPNAGKSSLLAQLTHATPEIAEYPFTTRVPIPGMMTFENTRFQIVDLPPVSLQHMEPGVIQVLRHADAVLWVVDLGDDDVLDRMEEVLSLIDLHEIHTLIVGVKTDKDGWQVRAGIVEEAYGGRFPMTIFSAERGLETFKRAVYDFLDVVRVYTKAPGKKPDLDDPYVLDSGSTVLDVAAKVHRELAERVRFAKLWRSGMPEGISVPRDFEVAEGDVVELHE